MFDYQHIDSEGQKINLPLGKIVCVGRNYLQHIKELANTVPSEPLLFIKPSTALTPLHKPLVIPENLGPCHNELEVAVLIKSTLCQATAEQAKLAIWGLGLGLDLTLRDVQSKLKEQGHPWERAKAFDASCPISQFVFQDKVENLSNLHFSLSVNRQVRQEGNTQDMLFPIISLLIYISETFTLLPGDIVMTGTPKGVAPLVVGDQLLVELEDHFSVHTYVA